MHTQTHASFDTYTVARAEASEIGENGVDFFYYHYYYYYVARVYICIHVSTLFDVGRVREPDRGID